MCRPLTSALSLRTPRLSASPKPTSPSSSPGRYVCLSVSDTGHGFDEGMARRLFEPFFTTRLAGTGLGLATVHEIVRDHDGAMNVRSKPGHGSRFEAWLSAAATDSIWQLLESLRWPQFTVASGK
jgi:signal transduction histidine kinase